MKRVAKISTGVSVVLLIIGIIDWATNYNWAQGDQNPLFNNQNVLLNDGQTIVIVSGLLLVLSAGMWILAARREHGDQRDT
jgi:hypothetical protein